MGGWAWHQLLRGEPKQAEVAWRPNGGGVAPGEINIKSPTQRCSPSPGANLIGGNHSSAA